MSESDIHLDPPRDIARWRAEDAGEADPPAIRAGHQVGLILGEIAFSQVLTGPKWQPDGALGHTLGNMTEAQLAIIEDAARHLAYSSAFERGRRRR